MQEKTNDQGDGSEREGTAGSARAAIQERPGSEGAEGQASRTLKDAAAEVARSVAGKAKGQLTLFPPTFDVRLLDQAAWESRQATMREWVELYQRRMLRATRIASRKIRRAAVAMSELEVVIEAEKKWRDGGA